MRGGLGTAGAAGGVRDGMAAGGDGAGTASAGALREPCALRAGGSPDVDDRVSTLADGAAPPAGSGGPFGAGLAALTGAGAGVALDVAGDTAAGIAAAGGVEVVVGTGEVPREANQAITTTRTTAATPAALSMPRRQRGCVPPTVAGDSTVASVSRGTEGAAAIAAAPEPAEAAAARSKIDARAMRLGGGKAVPGSVTSGNAGSAGAAGMAGSSGISRRADAGFASAA